MRVKIDRQGIVVGRESQAELERALLAAVGRYRDSLERVVLRLGVSRSGQRDIYHCRATAQLLGGKTVWADRSHGELNAAAEAALNQLATTVDEALRRGTAELPVLGDNGAHRALMGEGWAMLAPLL